MTLTAIFDRMEAQMAEVIGSAYEQAVERRTRELREQPWQLDMIDDGLSALAPPDRVMRIDALIERDRSRSRRIPLLALDVIGINLAAARLAAWEEAKAA